MPSDRLPIEDVVASLGFEDFETADIGMAACLFRIDEAAPLLRARLADRPPGTSYDETGSWIILRGLHVLAAARDTETFSPLLRLLEEPADELEWMLGDCITETLGKVVASVFDGDGSALLKAILRPGQDPFVRGALFGAATVLTRDGRIERSTMSAFLHAFALGTDRDEVDWMNWLEAVGLLGFSDLRPRAEWAFSTGAADDLYDLEWLDQALETAARDPSDPFPFEQCGLGYIDHPVEALSWLDPGIVDHQPVETPATNPWRGVGRNAPCPCGSGRKAKKCCLVS